MGTSCPVFSSCSRDKMNGGHLLIVTFLGFLALTDGGHLFGKGFVKGALKTLFKSEKKEQNCEIKWEDVWKPHCTTTYAKICKQEPQKECSTEWREDCHEPHHEPEEHHYSPKPSSHGHHESPEPTVQAGGQVKRSADEEHYEDDDDSLTEIDEKTLTESLENIPASELLKISQEIESQENPETGVATLGDESSRKKRSIHLLNLHLLGKHLLGKGLLGGKLFGKKAGAKKVAKATTVKHSSSSHSSHSSHTSHHKKCKNVKKCWWKPVKKCQETPVDSCWDEPHETCHQVPNERCWSEPKELCKKYPEEKCWETFHESCWDEPREHCTEKKIKVAKKWCEEPVRKEENAFDKIKKLF